jgi:hypothetical protein
MALGLYLCKNDPLNLRYGFQFLRELHGTSNFELNVKKWSLPRRVYEVPVLLRSCEPS